jgi:thiol-disulfide isomerase/thioredoxin
MRVSPALLTLGLAALLSGSTLLPAADDIGCDPKPSLDRLQPLATEAAACRKDPACLEKLEPRWQALLSEAPRNMRAYSSYAAIYGAADRAKVERAFRAQMEAHPKDAFYATAYGHALAEKADRLAAFRKALEIDPNYAWAHFHAAGLLTGRTSDGKGLDPEAAAPHVMAWLKACPGDENGLAMIPLLPDKAVATEVLTQSRAAVEASTGVEAGQRYAALWTAEFKVLPSSEHAALRARVRADAARLKTLGIEGSASYWTALATAYELSGDKPEREVAEKVLIARFPCEPQAVSAASKAWEKEHPRPDPYADDSVRREWAALRYTFDTERAHACPEVSIIAYSRVNSAREKGDLTAAEVEDVLDGYLAARPKASLVPAPMADVAVALCVNTRVRLDRVPELLQAWHDGPKPKVPADAEGRILQAYEDMRQRAEFDQIWYEARTEHLLGHPEARDKAMARMKQTLEETTGHNRDGYEAKIAWVRAEIAEDQHKTADALVLYQQAYAGLRGDPYAQRASREALKRLGASEETLATLAAPQPSRYIRRTTTGGSSLWKDVDLDLPAGALDRVGGGRWLLHEDLAGKRTLVDVWATWCEPCLQELPELQKLYDRIKDRTDVAVVAMNIDDNPGVVAPFLKERGYTFPVVLGGRYFDSLKLKETSIPRNWILDEKGAVKGESTGWAPNAREGAWAESVLAQLEGRTTTRTIVLDK